MIKINHIRLRSITATRTFGADITLNHGLNIVQADNTSGKSTCLQAVIYALGLERALGPRLEVPLPYAMRERIQAIKDGPYEEILQSYVMLELRNSAGDLVAIRRDIEGGKDRKLVQTWPGSTIDQRHDGGVQKDFFLHDSGSAIRADGFHEFLSRFIGWELPKVPKFDEVECPLYLETLFPMFFVEQKRGWSTTQGPFPTFFGIQDLARRVMEFILDLDAGKVRRRKAEIRKQILQVEQSWKNSCGLLAGDAGNFVRITGLPPTPTAEFSHNPEVGLSVFYSDSWVPISDVSADVSRRAHALESTDLPNAGEAEGRIRQRLDAAEDRNSELSVELGFLRREYQLTLTERQSLEKRVEALQIDLDRNKDAEKLQKLGSAIGRSASEHACPTCHQEVSQELLPELDAQGMGIKENIAFIRSQLDLYQSMLLTTESTLSDLRIRYKSLEEELSNVRSDIRALKNDLLRPSSSPIRSEIEELVRLQSRLRYLTSLQEKVDASIDDLRGIAANWVLLTDELKSLGSGQLTIGDQNKTRYMQDEMQHLLRNFGFNSFRPEEITLSDDNFRPQVYTVDEDGETVEKDIGFEASASDGIRLKWAYYLSLMALSKRARINHLGVVLFDEPGQQQMKDVDLSAFLNWASQNVGSDHQMIVSTSETLERVRESIGDGPATIKSFDGFILKPIESREENSS